MNQTESETLKFNGNASKGVKQSELSLFSCSASYDYRCGNCGNKLHAEVLKDFSTLLPDNKLCCPLCMSLEIEEVDK